MPASVIKSFAEKSGKSVEEVEELWRKAKQAAEEQGHRDEYDYIVGILKKMLKMDTEEGISTSDIAVHKDVIGIGTKKRRPCKMKNGKEVKIKEEEENEVNTQNNTTDVDSSAEPEKTDDTVTPERDKEPEKPEYEEGPDGDPIFTVDDDEYKALVARNPRQHWKSKNADLHTYVKSKNYSSNRLKFWVRSSENPEKRYKYIQPSQSKK